MLSDEQIKNWKLWRTRFARILSLCFWKPNPALGRPGVRPMFLRFLYHTDAIKHDPKNTDWEERDRIVLSNGHICPVLYAAMARAGYFPWRN